MIKMKICMYSSYRNECDPTQYLQKHDFHSHNEFEIYLFHSGNCNYLIHNKVYHLQPNDILIMNGLTLHRPNPIPTEKYIRSVLNFSAEALQSVIESLKFPDILKPFHDYNHTLYRGVDTELVKKIEYSLKDIAELNETFEKQENRDILITPLVYEAKMKTYIIQLLFHIYELNQTHKCDNPHVESEKQQHVKRITSWIEEHFHEEITLDDISKNLNLSKYYMSHIFKEITGGTIMKYLMSCRVNRAKILLETELNLSILEVALESGFKHSSHFSRFFLQKVGITPLEYRKRTRIATKGKLSNLK